MSVLTMLAAGRAAPIVTPGSPTDAATSSSLKGASPCLACGCLFQAVKTRNQGQGTGKGQEAGEKLPCKLQLFLAWQKQSPGKSP